MLNRSVFRTLTSCPRSSAAVRRRCVLYERSARDRIASFTGEKLPESEDGRLTLNPSYTTDEGGAAGAIVAGWREWISLPDAGVDWIKAKLDTGARTSAIHAFDLEHDGAGLVRFSVHPWQGSDEDPVAVEREVLDVREVRSSNGQVEERYVVQMAVAMAGRTIDAEVTLSRRDEMGFRMLVGREALAQGYLVDSGRSYAGGRPRVAVRRRNRGR